MVYCPMVQGWEDFTETFFTLKIISRGMSQLENEIKRKLSTIQVSSLIAGALNSYQQFSLSKFQGTVKQILHFFLLWKQHRVWL